MTPIYLSLIVLVVAAVLVFRGRHNRVQATPIDRSLDVWRQAVEGRLVPAFRLAQLPTVNTKETYASPKFSAGRPIGTVGWEWRIETPGASTIQHVRERLRQIESAVNGRRPLVAVMDVQGDPRHEGWGTLRAYRVDPIHSPRPISEVCAPGERLMKSPTSLMLVGVTRWGKETRLPLHKGSMAVFGQTQRGKSSAVHTMLANLLPHVADGTARLRFIDVSVKQGRGYRWLNRDGWFHSWATTPDAAFRVLDDMAAELAARADDGSDRELRIDRRNPLDVLIIEEGPAFLERKRGKTQKASDVIEDMARQVAAIGGVVVLVSQGALEVPPSLRRQLPTRVAFGLADGTESHNAFDAGTFTGGADGPHTIPPTDGRNGTVDWRGVSYVDDDGKGIHMTRWWWVDERWLKAHAAALRPARTGAR